MPSVYLLIILCQCSTVFTYTAKVTRERNADKFTPVKEECSQECGQRNGHCTSGGACCQLCTCNYGLTFADENGNQKCVQDIGHMEGCYYHLQGNEKRFQNTGSVTLKANSQIRVGLITTTGTSNPKLSNCSVISEDSQYWHVYLNWQPLFINNRRINNFFVGKKTITGITYQTLNFETSIDAVASSYNGWLLKLAMRCTEENTVTEKDSCLVFKVLGSASYESPVAVSSTTKPDTDSSTGSVTKSTVVLPSTSTPSKGKSSVTVIVLVILFIILCIISAVAIFLWRRRKRKCGKNAASFQRDSVTYNSKKKLLKKQYEDDENIYDAPQLSFGNKEEAVNDMGNPTYSAYLQPVDSTKKPLVLQTSADSEYHVPGEVLKDKKEKKKEKSSGYEFPKIEVTSMTKSTKAKQGLKSKHDYVHVSIDEPGHSYTDPSEQLQFQNPPLSSVSYASIDENTPSEVYDCIDDKNSKRSPTAKYASLDMSDENKFGDTNLAPGERGYAELDKTTLTRGMGPKYFELENENESDSKEVKYINMDDEETI